jgi:ADP-ribose pyrophosphatase YjhB (NUDIX family)
MNGTETRDAIWRPDVTVATIVPRNGRFLIVEEVSDGRLVLNQPAGHLEPLESLAHAAARETFEETGWHIELTGLLGLYQWHRPEDDFHVLRVAFIAAPLRYDAAHVLDTGIVRALWLTREELAAQADRHRSPMVLRNVDDFLAGQPHSLDSLVSLLPEASLL